MSGLDPATVPVPEPAARTRPLPGPGGRGALRALAGPAGLVWALAAVCAVGLVVLGWSFWGTVRVFAGTAVLSAFLLLVALYFGVTALRRVRPLRSSPRGWSWAGVCWGGTAATGCALLANGGLSALWSRVGGIDFGSSWGAALTAPLNEECLKTAGVVLIAVAVPARVRGPMDGWTLGAFTGLGFQMTENWTYAMHSVLMDGGTSAGDSALQSIIGRVGFTGLGSHWTMSAVAGTGVGLLLCGPPSTWRVRLAGAAGCLLTAMAMHWFFNAPLLLGVVGTAAKTGLDFCVALGFYLVLRHRLRRRARAVLLSPGTHPGAVRLLTRGGRRRARAALPPGPGRDAYARLTTAQLDLLEETAATGHPRPALARALTERAAAARVAVPTP